MESDSMECDMIDCRRSTGDEALSTLPCVFSTTCILFAYIQLYALVYYALYLWLGHAWLCLALVGLMRPSCLMLLDPGWL